MATCTSSTAAITGADPNFVAEFKSKNDEGVFFLLKFTIGNATSLSITFDVINTSLSSTDKYRMSMLNGSSLVSDTFVVTASGNYRVPIPKIKSEEKIYANMTLNAGGTTAVIVANIMEE